MPTLHPAVLFASRGHSHLRRLPAVVEWAATHGISRITLLICPEDEYTEEYAQLLETTTTHLMNTLGDQELTKGRAEPKWHLLIRQGLVTMPSHEHESGR